MVVRDGDCGAATSPPLGVLDLCGHKENADINAVRRIRVRGLCLLARGDMLWSG